MKTSYKKYLENNGVIVHPTDTVYGISGSYLSGVAYQKIFRLKKRPMDKPLAVLLSNYEQISLFSNISVEELAPIVPFLERGMTIIVERKETLPRHLLEQSKMIGLRIPDHKETLAITDECGPIVCTSANISGKPPITSEEEATEHFGEEVLFVEGEMGKAKQASTILSYVNGIYHLIREGHICKEEIKSALNNNFPFVLK